ncbi:hypothetical protein YC2023_102554 [Brassica napus]
MEEEHEVKRKIGDDGANIENIQRKVLWDEAAAMFRYRRSKNIQEGGFEERNGKGSQGRLEPNK